MKTSQRELCDNSADSNCRKCDTDSCNVETGKPNNCHRCAGIDCFEPPQNSIVECIITDQTSGDCYTGINGKIRPVYRIGLAIDISKKIIKSISVKGETVRDCKQNITDTSYCPTIDDGSQNCTLCSISACNNQIFPKNRLECHTCLANDCPATPESIKMCKTVSNKESCVTVFAANEGKYVINYCKNLYSKLFIIFQTDKVIERGCLSTLSNSNLCINEYDDTCFKCSGTKCNTAVKKPKFCIVCNSDDDPNCVLDLSKVTSRVDCPRDCFTKLEGINIYMEILT